MLHIYVPLQKPSFSGYFKILSALKFDLAFIYEKRLSKRHLLSVNIYREKQKRKWKLCIIYREIQYDILLQKRNVFQIFTIALLSQPYFYLLFCSFIITQKNIFHKFPVFSFVYCDDLNRMRNILLQLSKCMSLFTFCDGLCDLN